MIGYLKKLVLVIVVVASPQVFSSCAPNNYFDIHTGLCHPCSDCLFPRTPNQFCVKDCPGLRCEAGKYYDEHTSNCHLCIECKPPLTPNEFCQAQCTDDERNGRTPGPETPVATAGISSPASPSLETIVIIVVCTIMGVVVLVLLILVVLYWKNCRRKDKRRHGGQVHGPEQHREPFIKLDTNNGQQSVNIEMHSLPASRSDEPQQNHQQNSSLPINVQPCTDGSTHHHTNNQNNRLEEDSVELVDDRDQSTAHTPSYALGEASTRLQFSVSQDRSLKGNVVCQPENEEQDRCRLLPSVCFGTRDAGAIHGTLSPSNTRDAEQPHLSFDPNKSCGCEDHLSPNSSSMPNGFELQTSLKSSC